MLLLLLLLAFCFAEGNGETVDSKTSHGTVRGILYEFEDSSAEVYESIPFAKPPVGPLSFELPSTADHWTQVLDVRNHSTCYYYDTSKNIMDDCLRVKVVVPLDYKKARYEEKLPLIFWIHGGSYRAGGKHYYKNKGVVRYFSKRKVIFAAPNYRLGFEGFGSTGDSDMPGNFGLEDVFLALKFLRENANNFGIDLDSIVIAGESAGGAMAGIAAVSPRFKGLINGVIMISGTASGVWSNRNSFTLTNSRTVIQRCECARRTSAEIKRCLQSVASASCYRDVEDHHFEHWADESHSTFYETFRMGNTLFTPIADGFRGAASILPGKTEFFVEQNAHLPALITNTAAEQYQASSQMGQIINVSPSEWIEKLVPDKYNASTTVKKLLVERYIVGNLTNWKQRTEAFNTFCQEEWMACSQHEALAYARRNVSVYCLLADVYYTPLKDVKSMPSASSDHGAELREIFEHEEFVAYPTVRNKDLRVEAETFAASFTSLIVEFVKTRKLSNKARFTEQNRALTLVTPFHNFNTHFDMESYYFWYQLVPTLSRFNLDLPTAE